jgi:hypothetical protein
MGLLTIRTLKQTDFYRIKPDSIGNEVALYIKRR